VLVKPGIINGGSVTHDCPLSRSIGYFLEPLVAIAPFAKKPLQLTLKGVTSDERDLSVRLIFQKGLSGLEQPFILSR
jgi:RNA 3'-terminal phosphate cyclase-like protein